MINFTGIYSVSPISVDTNDLNPGDPAATAAPIWSLNSVNPAIPNITGIIAPTFNGAVVSKTLIITNTSQIVAFSFRLKNADIASAAANRLYLIGGADVLMGILNSIQLFYNPAGIMPGWYQVA